MSIKDFVNENENNQASSNITLKNNVAVRDNKELPSQKGSRHREESDLFPAFENEKVVKN